MIDFADTSITFFNILLIISVIIFLITSLGAKVGNNLHFISFGTMFCIY
jgi:hypothetical protein